MVQTKKIWTHTDVAFFIPNLIGYARFISLALSFAFAVNKERWPEFCICYGISYALDMLDGKAARMFD